MTTASTRLSSRLPVLSSVCAFLTLAVLTGWGAQLTPTVADVGGHARRAKSVSATTGAHRIGSTAKPNINHLHNACLEV